MAKRITLLNAGQAPTLLSATKGNEVINTINGLINSRASEKASSIGLRLLVEADGSLVLDATNELASSLQKLRSQTVTNDDEEGGDDEPVIPEGYSERTVSLVDNGTISSVTILVKD